MHQCVPSWDLDDSHTPPKIPLQTQSNSIAPVHVPSLDYEVAELTWENGHLAMHGLGPPRKPISNYGGTLESIVNQATRYNNVPDKSTAHGVDEVVPWFNNYHAVAADVPLPVTGSGTITTDALVPSSSKNTRKHRQSSSVHVPGVDGSTHVGSCSGATNSWMAVPRVGMGPTSVSCGGSDSRQLTFDTFDREFGTTMFTSTSTGSPENTSTDKQCTNRTGDDHDSVCHSRPQREAGQEKKKGSKSSSCSTKRKRAAAIHNQSERKRRDKINERMKTLQKLVPNSSKTDKASMLDEVIDYLKQLQAQVNMMSRMNMSPMMLPLAMQQQLQLSMMAAPMGIMGMGMAGVVDVNSLSRPNLPGFPPFLHPSAAPSFIPMTSWPADNASADRLATAVPNNVIPDPLAALLACQSQMQQPISMDAYSKMAAIYQQFQQPSASSVPKS